MTFDVRGIYYYEPFGKQITVANCKDRLSFIDKEKDKESMLGDFVLRKMSY